MHHEECLQSSELCSTYKKSRVRERGPRKRMAEIISKACGKRTVKAPKSKEN